MKGLYALFLLALLLLPMYAALRRLRNLPRETPPEEADDAVRLREKDGS
ncbi:hypothetical protein [Sphingomonas oleivorans]|nr:hypothetical protein [Sphingomonas oleivorans]